MKSSRNSRSKTFQRRMCGVEKLEQRHLLAAASLAFEAFSPSLEVADINIESIGLAPQELTVAGDLLFFTADDGVHGRELWKTDATAEGTTLVKDIVDGQGSAFTTQVSFVTTAVLNDTLFFIADDEQGNVGLWKSDGTSDGTTLVKELPGRPTEMLDVDNKLFLSIGTSLWASDGTTDGTSQLMDVVFFRPEYLTKMGTSLFFGTVTSLWTSDGTPGGTQIVKDVGAQNLAHIDGTLFFAGGTRRVGNGIELWKSDGTTDGTVEVKDIAPGEATVGPSGPLSSQPSDFTYVDGTVYFTVSGLRLQDLWKTDGTEAGTVAVSSDDGELFNFNDQLYIQDAHSITLLGANEPFTPDLLGIRNLALAENVFYFSASTASNGRELWKSDGTSTGTTMVADLNPGPVSSIANEPTVIYGDSVFFAADDGVRGTELWTSNGTETGTALVYDHGIGSGSNPHQLTAVGENLYFTADDGVTPSIQLWTADGEDAALLAALPEPDKLYDDPTDPPGSTSVDLINFIAVDDELVFSHYFNYSWASGNDQHEFELWKSDGTTDGTQLLQSSYYSYFSELVGPDPGPLFQTVHNGTLYYEYGRNLSEAFHRGFGSYDGEAVTELGFEDFTGASHFTTVGDKVFFSAIDPDNGRELWVTSDGFQTYQFMKNIGAGQTAGLLRPSFDFRPESTEMVEFNQQLYFTAGVDSREIDREQEPFVPELWKSDGTAAGTVRIAAVDDQHLSNLTVVDDKLFFTADTNPALWTSDGTEGGTVLVKQFEQIGADFVNWGGALYFSADAGEGLELWRSDGTEAGTQLVAEILPGEGGSAPASFAVIGEQLFFAADDGEHGREVWVSDGTTNGTRMYADIFVGAFSSDPAELTAIGNLLYFAADDGSRGRELWRADATPEETVEGDVNGDLVVDAKDIDAVYAAVATGSSDATFDLNDDNEVSEADATFLVEEILHTWRGDVDLNGRVDFIDFLILAQNFGAEEGASWSDGDMDGDGRVSFIDFVALAQNFGFDNAALAALDD